MSLAEQLNNLTDEAARQALENCCASPAWIAAMLTRRPFSSDDQVMSSAKEFWSSLPSEEWLAAFAAHPQIGDLQSLQKKHQSTSAWASGEQSSVIDANHETLDELARYNQLYKERFDFIFIVCATGKSAAEMLSLLKSRIQNDTQTELPIAAAEQLKITLLRLKKLAQA
jgi:OHCU decarboxylase